MLESEFVDSIYINSIYGEALVYGLTVTYLWPFTNIRYCMDERSDHKVAYTLI